MKLHDQVGVTLIVCLEAYQNPEKLQKPDRNWLEIKHDISHLCRVATTKTYC